MADTPERWRDIPGRRGYQASDQGRVRSVFRRLADGRWYGGKVLSASPGDKGYLSVSTGARQPVRVHVLVLAAWAGPRPPGAQIRHLNGNPADNRLSNLAYGTAAENTTDKIRHGTVVRGSGSPNAKLTEHQVREIRRRFAAGERQRDLFREYGVSRDAIHRIVRRKRWTHVSQEGTGELKEGQEEEQTEGEEQAEIVIYRAQELVTPVAPPVTVSGLP